MLAMKARPAQASFRSRTIRMAVLLNAIILEAGYTDDERWYWALIFSVPLFLILWKYKSKGLPKADIHNKFN